MSRTTFDPVFAAALRRELEQAPQARRVLRPIPRMGIAVRLTAAAALLVLLVLAVPAMGQLSQYLRGFSAHPGSAGTSAVASPTPTPSPTASLGMPVITPLAEPVTVTLSGTHVVDLGLRPAGANGFTYSFTCLTPDKFGLGTGGASTSCSEADVAGNGGTAASVVPEKLADGEHTYTITAAADARWTLTTTYVEWHLSSWGVNAKGETYGTSNENGEPDLIGVYATTGKTGYAYTKDLDALSCGDVHSPAEALACQAENEGKTLSVPVYESDGETKIGEFTLSR